MRQPPVNRSVACDRYRTEIFQRSNGRTPTRKPGNAATRHFARCIRLPAWTGSPEDRDSAVPVDDRREAVPRYCPRSNLPPWQNVPVHRPVDGDEQIPAMRLVRHLRQVLDVHVEEARLVVLERLPGLLLASHFGHKTRECCHTVAHQAAIQTGARDGRIDELTRQRQQVIQRQQQHAPQLDHQRFLARGEGRIERVRAMRAVLHVFPGPPLAHGGDRGVVAQGQLGRRVWTGMNLGTCSGRGARLWMNLAHWRFSRLKDSMTPRIRSRAMNSGQLRVGT